MKKIYFAITIMLLAAIPTGVMALDLSNIRLNGFVSQGYLDSSKNNYLDLASKDGTFQLNEAGITISAQATDKLRIGFQLLSRDLGPEGNNNFVLDWGFADYRINNALGARAGKIKMPMGLYNEGRDSDMLRDMVFLPQSIYEESWRSFMGAAQGASLYGNVDLGGLGDVEYQALLGEVNIDVSSVYLIQEGIIGGIEENGLVVNKLNFKCDNAFAASLVMNTALNGLRLGFSYLDVQGVFDGQLNSFGGTAFPAVLEPFTVEAELKDKYVLSAEYLHQYLSLRTEYMQARNNIRINGHPVLGTNDMVVDTAEGYFVMATVPTFTDALKLSALYDVYYSNKNHKGDTQTGEGYRKDIAIGLRYDVLNNWIIKAEYHDIEGTAPFLVNYNDDPLEKDWSYVVAKTTFLF